MYNGPKYCCILLYVHITDLFANILVSVKILDPTFRLKALKIVAL